MALSTGMVMSTPSLSIVIVYKSTVMTQNGLAACGRRPFYVAFDIFGAADVAVADKGGRSAKTMSPGANFGAVRTNLS